MYLNGSLSSLNNSTIELANNLRTSISSPINQIQQQTSNIIRPNSAVQSMGSNSNLNKMVIGLNNKASLPCMCRLCGNTASTMKCSECLGMQFCYPCDNMYHRHPKRKHHVRKSINLLNTTTNYFSNDDIANDMLSHSSSQSINKLPNVQIKQIRGLENSTSMSSTGCNMMPPLPPPRKKKLINPNELLLNTRRLPNMEQLNNELKAKLIMSNNPMSSSTGNLPQQTNQFNQLNRQSQIQYKINQLNQMNNMQNNLQYTNRRQSIDNWPTSKGSQNYAGSMSIQPPFLQNIQNMQQIQNIQNIQSNLIKNQQKQLLSPYLQRKNLSLTDINTTNVQMLANSFIPYATPFEMNSLSQSMDELMVDDESYSEDDNCSSNSSNRKHRQFNNAKKQASKKSRRSSSRGSSVNNKKFLNNNEKLIRSHSSAHLMNPMRLNPYDFDYIQQNQILANLYYGQPLLNAASISPASSIRSLDLVKRKNSVSSMLSNRTLVNNDFNDLENSYKSSSKNSSSSSKYRRSREQSSSNSRRSKSLCRSKSQSSNRSIKSFKSSYDKSNRCMSSDTDDVNNDESECSQSCSGESYSNLDDSTQNEFEDKRRKYNQTKKQWKCRHCTFLNRIQMNICEMCSKSNPQMLNNSNPIKDKDNKQSKHNSKIKLRNESNQTKQLNNETDQRTSYIEFTDELIKSQEEIEKELLRRIANEKLIEQENSKLENQQLNDKSRININNKQIESNSSIIKEKSTNSSPVSSTTSSNNLSNHQSNSTPSNSIVSNSTTSSKIVVSKIKPPSISLKQQNQINLTNKSTNVNKLTKTQSLDTPTNNKNSSSIKDENLSGRHREENFTKKQSSFGQNLYVQQSTNQQCNQRNFKQNKSEEQSKSSSNYLSDQSKESNSYDKKMIDGMMMFKLLREAEIKDYLAEELEIALSFNSTDPIGWLDDNWSSMKETVLNLANNQLVAIYQQSNSVFLNNVTDEDARSALRFTKGNIWLSVDRCVNQKKSEMKEIKQSKIPIFTPVNKNQNDVKSFSFNLKSFDQWSGNRDGNEAMINSLSDNSLKHMENLLNDWYQKNLKIQNKNEISNQPNTSEKVKNLISFLKQNGFFDTNKMSQDEINDQMKILMDLLEKKLKETQETNQSNEAQKSSKTNLIELNNTSASNNAILDTKRIDQEFDEIDEQMKKSLNFLEDLEQKTSKQIDEIKENCEIKRSNFKNFKITSKVSIDDDPLENDDFLESVDDPLGEPVHNVNIKLNNSNTVEASANVNIKKEKGKIKIIKRKIYRNSSSEEKKSIEKIAYVDNIEEADLINLDDEIDLLDLNKNKENVKEEINDDENVKEKLNYVNDQDYDAKQVNKTNQLLIDDDVEKQLNQLNPNFGYARTIYECGICCSKHHINELISMLFCEHRACKNCLAKYFTIQIREKQRVLIKCPFCDQPEIQSDDENAVHDYLTLLQELVKNIVTKDLYELFQRKIRDRTLQKEPGFRWCANCCSGFLANNIEGQVLRCPDCKSLCCSKCGEIWQEEHRMLNCDQFKQYLMHGSEWITEHKLNIHLNEFGVICPRCKYKYELSKGGCLHFKCLHCEFEFCYGCDASFRTGDKCSSYGKSCEKMGFHAHHPRNCLFYLRDKKAEDLEKLLKSNNIDYEIRDFDKEKTECHVMEQKETESGLKDEYCGRAVEKNGICSLHYIEHLARLIKRNQIDVLDILDETELINVLKREQIDVPKKIDYKNYKSKLIETIEKHSPLI